MSTTVVERARGEWLRFRDDQPGRRFRNYRARLQQKASRGLRLCGVVLGVIFVLAGIAMCFLPGPGLLVILFGLALFGGESRWLAARLDRLEPAIRRRAIAARRWWKGLPLLARAGLVVLAISATGVAMRAWWYWFGP